MTPDAQQPEPLLDIRERPNGSVVIKRYPFETVFNSDEVKELEEYFSTRPNTTAPEPVTIRLRKPMRDLPSGKSAEWQVGYRDRLLKQIIDARNIPKEKWYEYFKSISTTCPDCFCPNLEEHYAEISNSKGFHCPACGNSFDLPIVPFSLIDSTAIAKQERERVLDELNNWMIGMPEQIREPIYQKIQSLRQEERQRVLDEVITIIRAPEECAEAPSGWLWQQPRLVARLESLRRGGEP